MKNESQYPNMFVRSAREQDRILLDDDDPIPCWVEDPETGACYEGALANISETGVAAILTESPENLQVEANVVLRTQLPDMVAAFRVNAVIRHVTVRTSGCLVGLELISLESPSYFLLQLRRLQRFLKDLLERTGGAEQEGSVADREKSTSDRPPKPSSRESKQAPPQQEPNIDQRLAKRRQWGKLS